MREYRQFDPSIGTTRQVEPWQPYQVPLTGIPEISAELIAVAGVILILCLIIIYGGKSRVK